MPAAAAQTAAPEFAPAVTAQPRSVADYRKRWGALLDERRKSWDSHYQTIADYIMPRRLRFNTDERNRGQALNQNIINNTPLLAVRTLAAGMMSSITSPSRAWFRLTTSDPDAMDVHEARVWLWKVEERMREVFQKSNLYNCLQQLYNDLIPFGTSPLLMMHDDQRLVRFHVPPVGSYCLASSAKLRADTLFRQFSMTALQLMTEFGEENVSDTVKNALRAKNPDRWIDVIHCIEPNARRKPGKFDNHNLGWTDVYFEAQGSNEQKFLREGGHFTCPLAAPRWDVTGEDVYGRSPGMDNLGDIKGLQLLQKRLLQLVDKTSAPPLATSVGMRTEKISLLSGDVTYVSDSSGAQGVAPIMTVPPQAIREVRDEIAAHQERIGRGFFVDLWLALTEAAGGREMTAEEVRQRTVEKMSILGPVLERLENELLDVLIERTFDLMARGGLLPLPIPDVMKRQELRVEYLSQMAQAQKFAGTISVQQYSAYVASMAQLTPNIMDRLNEDEAAETMALMLGTPPQIVRSIEEARKMRAERRRQQQAQEALAQAKAAQAGSAAIKNLGDAKVGDQSALERIATARTATQATPQPGAQP